MQWSNLQTEKWTKRSTHFQEKFMLVYQKVDRSCHMTLLFLWRFDIRNQDVILKYSVADWTPLSGYKDPTHPCYTPTGDFTLDLLWTEWADSLWFTSPSFSNFAAPFMETKYFYLTYDLVSPHHCQESCSTSTWPVSESTCVGVQGSQSLFNTGI